MTPQKIALCSVMRKQAKVTPKMMAKYLLRSPVSIFKAIQVMVGRFCTFGREQRLLLLTRARRMPEPGSRSLDGHFSRETAANRQNKTAGTSEAGAFVGPCVIAHFDPHPPVPCRCETGDALAYPTGSIRRIPVIRLPIASTRRRIRAPDTPFALRTFACDASSPFREDFMNPIKTILFPTDQSELCRSAFCVTSALARDCKARLIILEVVPPPVMIYGPPPESYYEQMRDALDQLQCEIRRSASNDWSLKGTR